MHGLQRNAGRHSGFAWGECPIHIQHNSSFVLEDFSIPRRASSSLPGKPHARSFVSGVSESTLQQYADQGLPTRSEILIKLAHAANVSIEWLATDHDKMRAAGR